MKKNYIGLSIFIIILAIFYYEIKTDLSFMRKEIRTDFSRSHRYIEKEEIKYKYKNYKEENVDSIYIEAVRGEVNVERDDNITGDVDVRVKLGLTNKQEVSGVVKEKKGNKLLFKKNVPEGFNGIIGYEIKISKPLDIEVYNKFGENRIVGTGKTFIYDEYSPCFVTNVSSLYLSAKEGDIEIDRVSKEVKIDTSYSEISITDVGENVEINTKYGDKIVIDEVDGNLVLNTKYTPLFVSDIKGDAKITNKYSDDLEFNNIDSLEINADYSDINLENVKLFELIGKSNKIEIKEAQKIKVEGEDNSISGESRFMHIQGKRDTVVLEVMGGKIIESNGKIKLQIPLIEESMNLDLTATPSFIKIENIDNTYFSVTNSGAYLVSSFIKIEKENSISRGTYGDKSSSKRFILKSKYSNITINKQEDTDF